MYSELRNIKNTKMFLQNKAERLMKTTDYSRLYFWGSTFSLSASGQCYEEKLMLRRFIAFLIQVINLSVVGFCIMFYSYTNKSDFNECTNALNMLIIPGLTIIKLTLAWYYSKSFQTIINDAMDNFLPYDIIRKENINYTLTSFKYYNTIIASFYSLGFTLVSSLLISPQFMEERTLPLPTDMPFNWTSSPIYEILYVCHVTAFYSVVCNNIGIDFFVFAVLLSTSQQYSILTACCSIINTSEVYEINKNMRKFYNDGLEKKYDDQKEYFVRLLRHHQFLLRFCKSFKNVLNVLELSQLIFGFLGICLTTLRLSYMNELSLIALISSLIFMIGISIQLFGDCFLGTWLYHEANLLPESIFHSNWRNFKDEKLKKDIVFFLQNSQRVPQFKIYSLFDLCIISFVKVVKLAFSMYTVLSSLKSN